METLPTELVAMITHLLDLDDISMVDECGKLLQQSEWRLLNNDARGSTFIPRD